MDASNYDSHVRADYSKIKPNLSDSVSEKIEEAKEETNILKESCHVTVNFAISQLKAQVEDLENRKTSFLGKMVNKFRYFGANSDVKMLRSEIKKLEKMNAKISKIDFNKDYKKAYTICVSLITINDIAKNNILKNKISRGGRGDYEGLENNSDLLTSQLEKCANKFSQIRSGLLAYSNDLEKVTKKRGFDIPSAESLDILSAEVILKNLDAKSAESSPKKS